MPSPSAGPVFIYDFIFFFVSNFWLSKLENNENILFSLVLGKNVRQNGFKPEVLPKNIYKYYLPKLFSL